MIVKVIFDDGEELVYSEKEYRYHSRFQQEILENLDRYEIEEYAEYHCDMTPEDELPRITDFGNDDLISELEYRGFSVVDEDEDASKQLDYFDERRLKEITERFLTGGWVEREELYRKIFG